MWQFLHRIGSKLEHCLDKDKDKPKGSKEPKHENIHYH